MFGTIGARYMGVRFDKGLVQLTRGTLGARYVRVMFSNTRLVSRMWPEKLIVPYIHWSYSSYRMWPGQVSKNFV